MKGEWAILVASRAKYSRFFQKWPSLPEKRCNYLKNNYLKSYDLLMDGKHERSSEI